MFGLGKSGKFSKFLRRHQISQKELAEKSGVSKSTISRLAQGDGFTPNMKTGNKIIKTLRSAFKKDVDYDDFWA